MGATAPGDHLRGDAHAGAVQTPRPKALGAMLAPDCGPRRALLWARSMTQPAPETIRTPKTRIACDGTGDGLANAALGHPRVWLEIDPEDGFADCGYCDRRFILIGGVADKA